MTRSTDRYLPGKILRASGLVALLGAGVGFLWGWLAYGALELGFLAPYVIGCAAASAFLTALAVFLWHQIQRRTVAAQTTSGSEAALSGAATRKTEIIAFFLLSVVIWPFIAVGIVGSFGFLVWMWQMVFGPSGPPN